MIPPHVDLTLPDAERGLAASLSTPWRDLLYAPGPDLTSPIDPGAYRSSLIVVRDDGVAVRVTSLVTPAFGGELCRLRLETLARSRDAAFGSFFEPSRTGTIYPFTPAPHAPALPPPH